jgi:hypothetical protein
LYLPLTTGKHGKKIHGKGPSEHGKAFTVCATRKKTARQRTFAMCLSVERNGGNTTVERREKWRGRREKWTFVVFFLKWQTTKPALPCSF